MAFRATHRVSTTLVIDADSGSQRKLVLRLTALGHRVVPVASADQGIDLAQRFRFDVLLCSHRLPGLKWDEFSARARKLAGAVLLIDEAEEMPAGADTPLWEIQESVA